jgi:molybdenum cofactor biosynthesis enzyme MoaA
LNSDEDQQLILAELRESLKSQPAGKGRWRIEREIRAREEEDEFEREERRRRRKEERDARRKEDTAGAGDDHSDDGDDVDNVSKQVTCLKCDQLFISVSGTSTMCLDCRLDPKVSIYACMQVLHTHTHT